MTTSERRALHAFLTADAHDQWHDFAAEQGASVSAILEALAPELDDAVGQLAPVVKAARRIDAERRRRSRR